MAVKFSEKNYICIESLHLRNVGAKEALSLNWSQSPNSHGVLDTRMEDEESFSWLLSFLPLVAWQYEEKDDNTSKNTEEEQ